MEYSIVGFEGLPLSRGRFNQHGSSKQGMPGGFGNNPDRQPVIFIRAAPQILDKNFFAFKMFQQPGVDAIKMVLADSFVDFAPADSLFRGLVFDNKFVVGGPTRVFAGRRDKGATLGQRAFAAK